MVNKKELRQQIRAQKRAMTEAQIEEKSRILGEKFRACPQYARAKTVYGYLPYNQEVRTVPMLRQALLDGKAAVELLGYAPAPELGSTLVYLSVENLSAKALAVGTSYLQSREMTTTEELYRLGTGLTAVCDGQPVRCGSFAAPLYGENAADASAFTLNLAAGRGAMLHCFCETPEDWNTLELTYQPDFASGQTMHFVVRRDMDEVQLGAVPTTPAEVGSVVDL